MNLPPYNNDPRNWYTVAQMASMFKRSRDTIERWCKDGTILAAGMSIYRDHKRRIFIRYTPR